MDLSKDIAYCGLYCGDCIIKDGKLGALSEELLGHMKTESFKKIKTGLPKIFPELCAELEHSDVAQSVLKAMCHLDCTKKCKEGGGSSACKIRNCCLSKQLKGCWECHLMETCDTLAKIEPVHARSNIRNMKRIQEVGVQEFIKGPKEW